MRKSDLWEKASPSKIDVLIAESVLILMTLVITIGVIILSVWLLE